MEDIVAKASEYWKKEKQEIDSYIGEKRFAPKMITTSQIRKFLTAVNATSNKVQIFKAQNPRAKELSGELVAEIKYLQVPLVYQAGRDKFVKNFISGTKMIDMINAIGNDIRAYDNFAKYVEALVAYHKFYGGKDK